MSSGKEIKICLEVEGDYYFGSSLDTRVAAITAAASAAKDGVDAGKARSSGEWYIRDEMVVAHAPAIGRDAPTDRSDGDLISESFVRFDPWVGYKIS